MCSIYSDMKFGLPSVSYRSEECPHEPGAQRLVQNQQVLVIIFLY